MSREQRSHLWVAAAAGVLFVDSCDSCMRPDWGNVDISGWCSNLLIYPARVGSGGFRK